MFKKAQKKMERKKKIKRRISKISSEESFVGCFFFLLLFILRLVFILRVALAMPKKRRKISLFPKPNRIHDLINCIYGNRHQQQLNEGILDARENLYRSGDEIRTNFHLKHLCRHRHHEKVTFLKTLRFFCCIHLVDFS
jgi:hypothetical protein